MYLKIFKNLSLLAISFFKKTMPTTPIKNSPVDLASTDIPNTMVAGIMNLDWTDSTIFLGSTFQYIINSPKYERNAKVNSDYNAI